MTSLRWVFPNVLCLVVFRDSRGQVTNNFLNTSTDQTTSNIPTYTVALDQTTTNIPTSTLARGCGGNLYGEGTITTPGYPSNYPPHASCYWSILAIDGLEILLEFLDFSLDKDSSGLCIEGVFYDIRYCFSGTDNNITSLRLPSQIVVYFSGRDITTRGFSLRFKSVAIANETDSSLQYASNTFTSCGSNLTNEGTFTSPYYPGQYPNRASCTWLLHASPGTMLQLFCLSFDLEYPSDNVFVSSQVYNKTAPIYNWLSGNASGCSMNLGSNATVLFISDGAVRNEGFAFGFRSIPPPINQSKFTSCGGRLEGSYGVIRSPNYPNYYPSNAFCVWYITAQGGNQLRLHFSQYQVEESYDSVKIYDSPEINQNATIIEVQPIFGSRWWMLNNEYRTGAKAVVVFSADGSVEEGGFSLIFWAEWKQVANDSTEHYFTTPSSSSTATKTSTYDAVITTKPSTMSATAKKSTPTSSPKTTLTTKSTTKLMSSTARTTQTCGGVLYNEAVFSSPNFPVGYPNNAICKWTLIASPGSNALLRFHNFALESDADYLRIYNGTDVSWGTSFISYTGFSIPPQLLLTESVTVVFASNEKVTFQGFKANFTSISLPGASNTTFYSTATPGVCGIAIADLNTHNQRITGGYVAEASSAPWQVLITRASKYFGGVLLNNRWVITAASNLKSMKASAFTLLLGKVRLNAEDHGQRKVSATAIVRYPGYNQSTGDGDIALIKLSTYVGFTTKIRPICLPTETVQAGKVCYATGFGMTAGSGGAGRLKVARVTIIERLNCSKYVNPLSDNQICGGFIHGGEDVCQGDAGGPLAYFNKGRYELQGITSRTSCGKPFSPSAFTAVAPYIRWINKVAF